MIKKIFKIFLLIAAAAAVLLIALRGFVSYSFHYAPFRGERFDRQKWHAYDALGGNDAECVRGAMVGDVRKNIAPVGTSKEKVIEILGPNFDNAMFDKEGCIEYSLGMCSGLKIDYDHLVVCFDKQSKVSKTYHYQS